MPNVRQELSYDVLDLLCFLISLYFDKLEVADFSFSSSVILHLIFKYISENQTH